jgi:hypothetical protein
VALDNVNLVNFSHLNFYLIFENPEMRLNW